MKNSILLAICMLLMANISIAQTKKDGTPDMRFKANKDFYGTSSNNSNSNYNFTTPSYNSGTTNNDVRYQNGYTKDNGTYVDPHYKTNVNNTNWDNLSTKDNYNIYNNTEGTKARDYSKEAQNYGSGNTIYEGPKGGQYYYNSNGNKTYVPKK